MARLTDQQSEMVDEVARSISPGAWDNGPSGGRHKIRKEKARCRAERLVAIVGPIITRQAEEKLLRELSKRSKCYWATPEAYFQQEIKTIARERGLTLEDESNG